MNILFIAPIPPPIDGQSKASKVLFDRLIIDKHNVAVINLTKKNGLRNSFNSLIRVFSIISILCKIWHRRRGNDIIYLSLAESFFGNLRDLFIYSICFNSIDKFYIHMLGGAGMKEILESKGLQRRINKFFISKVGGVFVEGSLNFDVFSKVIDKWKIHIVPNFSEDYLFANDNEIDEKFYDTSIIKILYLSNLLPGKGYDELVDAYIGLTAKSKQQIEIVFVGSFQAEKDKFNFFEKISNHKNLKYLGQFIDGEKKRELFCKSHIFCLPTYYAYEGQPISILEAYATGCVVITSNHSGIPFVFSDEINGYIVEKQSIISLQNAIDKALNDRIKLKSIAFTNRNIALEKYKTTAYQNTILDIFINR